MKKNCFQMTVAALIVSMSLAACSKKEDAQTAEGAEGAAVATEAVEVDMKAKAGKWEITTTTTAAGQTLPSAVTTVCLTEDSDFGEMASTSQSGGQAGCTTSDIEKTGNKMALSIKCETPKIENDIAFTFVDEDNFTMDMTSKTDVGGQAVTAEINAKYKYLGACD